MDSTGEFQYKHDFRIIMYSKSKKFGIQTREKGSNIWYDVFKMYSSYEETKLIVDDMRSNEEFIIIKAY